RLKPSPLGSHGRPPPPASVGAALAADSHSRRCHWEPKSAPPPLKSIRFPSSFPPLVYFPSTVNPISSKKSPNRRRLIGLREVAGAGSTGGRGLLGTLPAASAGATGRR
ncbi:Os04g0295901, partial [Oryza sativa Japonica Group]